MSVPEDVHKNWFNVIRRIQSVANSRNVVGIGIVQINVVINDRGEPVLWTEPKCTLIEPKKRNHELIAMLTDSL